MLMMTTSGRSDDLECFDLGRSRCVVCYTRHYSVQMVSVPSLNHDIIALRALLMEMLLSLLLAPQGFMTIRDGCYQVCPNVAHHRLMDDGPETRVATIQI